MHGYRPDALERLGYGAARRRTLNPDLIDVALCAYGWAGPWAGRRGFDSLVQMAAGIAAAGQRWMRAERPVPLPVQALDHATGYLMAAASIRGLIARRSEGRAVTARLSLARTACLLTDHPGSAPGLRLRRISRPRLRPADGAHGVGTGPCGCTPGADRRRASALGSPGRPTRRDGRGASPDVR